MALALSLNLHGYLTGYVTWTKPGGLVSSVTHTHTYTQIDKHTHEPQVPGGACLEAFLSDPVTLYQKFVGTSDYILSSSSLL